MEGSEVLITFMSSATLLTWKLQHIQKDIRSWRLSPFSRQSWWQKIYCGYKKMITVLRTFIITIKARWLQWDATWPWRTFQSPNPSGQDFISEDLLRG